MAYLFVLVVILLVQGIAGASVNQKTENSNEKLRFFSKADYTARDGEFPYHVSIQGSIVPDVYIHFCSGVLISNEYVLTTASCYSSKSLNFIVKAGSVSQSYNEPEVQTFFVNTNKSFIHEKYDEKNLFSDNNIALIKLDKKVEVTKHVKPVTLPSSSEKLISSLEYTVTGWGFNSVLEPNLKFFKLYIIDNDVCKISLNYRFPNSQLTNNQICTVSAFNKIYTRDGDYGNPLVRFDKDEAVLVGIASALTYVSEDEKCEKLIFTKISAYLDWINEKQGNGAFGLTYGYFMIFIVALSVFKNLFN